MTKRGVDSENRGSNDRPEGDSVGGSGAGFDSVAVVGGGAWGTALALTALRAGRYLRLWAREPEVVEAIDRRHENEVFLPGVPLPEVFFVSSDLPTVCADAEVVLLVVPSQFLRAVAEQVEAALPAGVPVIVCAKGIERETGLLMTQVVEQAMPGRPLAVLSGPTFATEVAADQPTAVTLAAAEGEGALAARLAAALSTPTFRIYAGQDPVGVEVGGAVKNVIAIACGIAQGLGFGSNTRAALITRGLAEIKRLAEALGGARETVSGLAGLGDLTLTCSSEQSRNFSFGLGLGRGETAEALLAGRQAVVEGVINAVTVTDLARKLGVELPICEAVRAVVHEGQPIAEAMTGLLHRPLTRELGTS
ncbi:NAD(P)H-dependent glycerol-3-phosphate dehydrogenase [Algihabitans albus]|uniref:NAD(P)H-dependent glycerol-3-phosphate dehydrogenase n=1 Tax=Algihabitans albus TaxID=2164067 RepID=UPI000E5D9B1C|nr:NAD(P)H-dependent glycerol-3-phosphate dehydrogenase [Algihabitans albus]